MNKPIQTVEELDAVLHWRGKHAQAIRERDALQLDLNQRDEQIATLDLQREAHLRNSQVAERRVGVLEQEVERLNRVKLALNELAERRADNCSVYRQHLSDALMMAEKVRDASLGMQRKYLSDLIVHLYLNSGAALKPAEPAKCERCGGSTVETCDERGCGYLGAGNGAPE